MSQPTDQSSARPDGNVVKSPRLLFIDVIRGYAILMMLQGHTIGLVLSDEHRNHDNFFYGTWYYLKGLTAPVFLTAAGFIFAYLMVKKEAQAGGYYKKGIIRGLWLMGMGFLLQIKPANFLKLGTEEWRLAFSFLETSHVLHAVGLGIIWIVLIRLLFRNHGFSKALGGLAMLSFLFGAWVYSFTWTDGFLRCLGTFVNKEYAVFPILPWGGFALMGAALGVSAWKTQWQNDPRNFLKLAIFGGAVMMIAGLTKMIPVESCFFIAKMTTALWRAGEVLILFAGVACLCQRAELRGKGNHPVLKVLSQCGQETFFIYFLHAIMIYGCITDLGLNSFCEKELGVVASLLIALVVEVFFITVAFKLPVWRQRLPWLRYLR